MADALVEFLAELGAEPERAFARVPELFTDDVHFEDPIVAGRGHAAFIAANRRLVQAARSLYVEVKDRAASGDTVYLTWIFHYTPVVGPALHVSGVTHARMRDGRVAHHRDYWDVLGALGSSIPGAAGIKRWLARLTA
jgi:hypothetical protein